MAEEALDSRWLVMLHNALQQVSAELLKYPDEPALSSVLSQLEYLIALADGRETDRSALSRVNLGYLAAYPLAGLIPDNLDRLLCEIADKIRRDLKKRKLNTGDVDARGEQKDVAKSVAGVSCRQSSMMLRNAWQQVRAGMLKYPHEPTLLLVLRQLEYLIALADGKESDRSALARVDLGHLARHNLSGVISDDLSKLLAVIAEKVRQELEQMKQETGGEIQDV